MAIRFAYTGKVRPCNIRQALVTLRVADYLEITGCGAACVAWISRHLAAAARRSQAYTFRAAAAKPPILQLYGCSGLWPDPAADAAFAAVLTSATRPLARHFGNALTALNWPPLREQLLKLSAAGIEALLTSDMFGTDSEDSVLTLLAVWMEANWAFTDAAARTRLARLLRLAQLSSTAACLLSALAADYELHGEDHPAGWLPISPAQALLLGTYASSPPLQQEHIRQAMPFPAWCDVSPRRRCLPYHVIGYTWIVSRKELQAGLEGAVVGEPACVRAKLDERQDGVVFGGLSWQVAVEHKAGDAAARLCLRPVLPAAYQVEGSRLAPGGSHHGLPLPVDWAGRMILTCRLGRILEDGEFQVALGPSDAMTLNQPWGVTMDAAKPARARAAARAVAGAAGGATARPNPLAPWAPFLHSGKVRGRLTLLPSGREDEAQALRSDRESSDAVESDDAESEAEEGVVMPISEDKEESGDADSEDEEESGDADSEDEEESGDADREDEVESGDADREDEEESGGADSEDEEESGDADREDEVEIGDADREDEEEGGDADREDEVETGDADSEDE
ncbi:hypothetical protein HYH03_008251 [Edaphochlamys debaryana]|uniref:BACK domain-containing protein n=1 Tax=Edaphochlamys debaryana TaxID=47281 RepID=A0A835Y1C2_9CHLO|nr:hypothetical protein HYH03_008251 [Edaphochlamys debaryana]|eukprot:KAG2493432.1 hypothetical protein HYH03_008251 [Edaphochlamys debaryana]